MQKKKMKFVEFMYFPVNFWMLHYFYVIYFQAQRWLDSSGSFQSVMLMGVSTLKHISLSHSNFLWLDAILLVIEHWHRPLALEKGREKKRQYYSIYLSQSSGALRSLFYPPKYIWYFIPFTWIVNCGFFSLLSYFKHFWKSIYLKDYLNDQ